MPSRSRAGSWPSAWGSSRRSDVEILDLRPRPERWLAARPPVAGGGLAALAGRVADALARRRVAGRRPAVDHALVVSVGNLRVGGTGKTPVVAALAGALASRGIPGAVVTRGHGGQASGPLAVCPGDASAGDEARLLAARLQDWPWQVIQARDRQAGVDWLGRHVPGCRVILLEDAHQTARVGRHLEVVILDRWEQGHGGEVAPRAGPVLPFGPYRETIHGAARADVWLLETTEESPGSANGPAVCRFTRSSRLAVAQGSVPAGGPVGLLAGLARPERLEADAIALFGRRLALAVRLGDHVAYHARLLARILAAGRDRGVVGWLTTEKDWVKLATAWPAAVPVTLVVQEVVWGGTPTLPDLVAERLAVLGGASGGPAARG